MTMSTFAVEVEDLVKTFGDFVAVDHIRFQVKRGEIFGFLGHIANDLFNLLWLSHDIKPCHLPFPGCGHQEATEHSDGRGFPRPIGPQKPKDLSPLHLETNMIHSDEVSEGLH